MPVTKKKKEDRTNIRIPKPMVDEVDRLIELHKALHWNRQQFIETAIREKILAMRQVPQEGGVRLVSV